MTDPAETDMRPLSIEQLGHVAARADGSTVYVRAPLDMPGVAEAGDLVHCKVEIDADGDLIISVYGSSAYDPQPMRPWPLSEPPRQPR